MSHILKKISIAGGGRGSRPQPPVYRPPILGEMQYGASHSFAETVDLISDGPIEGIVDRDGRVLKGIRLLQGVYLDDTPVAVSNNPEYNETISDVELEAAQSLNCILDNGTNTATRNLKRFFRELGESDQRSNGALIRNLSSDDGDPPAFESQSWPDCSLYYRQEQREINPFNLDDDGILLRRVNTEGFGLRAYIRDEVDSKEFTWFLNNEAQSASSSNARFSYEARLPTEHKSIDWADASSKSDAKLLVSLYTNLQPNFYSRGGETGDDEDGDNPFGITHHWSDWNSVLGSLGYYFLEALERVIEFTSDDLDSIRDLINDNQITDDSNYNSLQRTLAEKALSSLGDWSELGNAELIPNAIANLESQDEESPCLLVVVKVNETGSSELNKNISIGSDADGNVILEQMVTRPFGTERGYAIQNLLEARGVKFFDVTCPTLNQEGTLTGEMKGFILIKIPLNISINQNSLFDELSREGISISEIEEHLGNQGGVRYARNSWQTRGYTYSVDKDVYNLIKDIESFQYTKTTISQLLFNEYSYDDLKFNFSNVLAEFREGSEYQNPLSYFKTVFIDHVYQRELFGAFNADKLAGGSVDKPETPNTQTFAPQRISQNTSLLTRSEVLSLGAENYNLEVGEDGLPLNEGSDDKRANNRDNLDNYSEWARQSLTNWNEDAVPVVHTVYNPNVTRAFISLNVAALSDTLTFDLTPSAADREMQITAKFPAVLNIRVETGQYDINPDGSDGLEKPFKTYNYRIVALIEGNTLIDIGNPDYQGDSSREFVVNLDGKDALLNKGFELPPTVTMKQELLSADGESGIEAGTIDEDSTVKRYVKVTKLSFETNSVLINKNVTLDKVTEIIDTPLPYPFSAIVGTKIDSRSFTSIPRRTYDCKLKKVKIPSNYKPVRVSGKDKRYYNNQSEFDLTSKADKLVYDGDWDGSFKEGLHWTDNPAWILYDLLTNSRYGMGSHINPNNINVWELYKIGRFCDAVDELGFFEGVSDGRGGKEPRFSCNIVFDQGQKIFDAINIVASLFKGRVFFNDSTINFVDDRPRNPVNIFTNESVKDGQFFYANNRRDEQFNTIEVAYNDRFDNFVPKIEVVEDEDNIKEKGVFKKRIEGIGITSRAMARRVAQHQIFSKIKENQQVAFTAGLESLLCKPGDLVLIEDDLKTNTTNFGKILAIDLENETIRVSNTFVNSDMNKVLTVINPTGDDTQLDIQTGFASTNRTRYAELEVTGSTPAALLPYTGKYSFSGYTEGYAGATGAIDDPRFQQYAFYTGLPESETVLYFETGVTGWVFASGTGVGNKSAFDLFSGDLISELTGDHTLAAVGTGKFAVMDMVGDKRSSTLFSFNGFNSDAYIGGPTRGALETDLNNLSPDQLTTLNVTSIFSTPAELSAENLNNYGSLLSGFDKPEVLRNLKLGSPARLQIKNADPFIYKVISMQEENVNEYLVTATKYDTGKFALIEDDISIEHLSNTFSYNNTQTVEGVTYSTLPTPSLSNVTTGVPDASTQTFNISGEWGAISNSTGYNVRLNLPNGSMTSVNTTNTNFSFSGLSQVGSFRYSVNALGNKATNNASTAFFDSDYDTSGIFVVYDDALLFTRSFIERITIL